MYVTRLLPVRGLWADGPRALLDALPSQGLPPWRVYAIPYRFIFRNAAPRAHTMRTAKENTREASLYPLYLDTHD